MELFPEGYEPIPERINRAAFAVIVYENHLAGPSELCTVSFARVIVLEELTNPLPEEPFTTHFSRRTMTV